jgi:hypothetical protein
MITKEIEELVIKMYSRIGSHVEQEARKHPEIFFIAFLRSLKRYVKWQPGLQGSYVRGALLKNNMKEACEFLKRDHPIGKGRLSPETEQLMIDMAVRLTHPGTPDYKHIVEEDPEVCAVSILVYFNCMMDIRDADAYLPVQVAYVKDVPEIMSGVS